MKDCNKEDCNKEDCHTNNIFLLISFFTILIILTIVTIDSRIFVSEKNTELSFDGMI